MTLCPAPRERDDRCPGTLRPHVAADGLLVRVRAPGGMLAARVLRMLADAARELGDGRLGLTSRANLQLRGLSEAGTTELAARLAEAGLLPSPAHERVRNIIASPLTGLDNPVDVTDLITGLDTELCRSDRLAELPGRFLFAADDGRGDTAALGADVRAVAAEDGETHLSPGGFTVRSTDAVAAMTALALAFLDVRDEDEGVAWRIRELRDGPARVAARARNALAAKGIGTSDARCPNGTDPAPPAGVVAQRDGQHSVVVLPPLGRLDAAQARLLARLAGPRGVRVTPWRSIVVTDVRDPAAAVAQTREAGFDLGRDSVWSRVSACAGKPGCAKALADVQADALAVHARAGRAAGRVHWSGCERRCGRPAGEVVDVIATGTGYAVGDARGSGVAHYPHLDAIAPAITGAQENR